MNRITILALISACAIALAATSCGGDKKPKAPPPATMEQAQKKLSEMTGVEKCQSTWQKRYGLKLVDVQPDFEFAEKEDGYDRFSGNGVNSAQAVYQKKDGSPISTEEYHAYLRKIYSLTQRLAQDGKNVKGFGGMGIQTRDQALAELPLDEVAQSTHTGWSFLKGDRFETCYISLVEATPNYITLTLGEGLQKNLDEALKDAEKYMN